MDMGNSGVPVTIRTSTEVGVEGAFGFRDRPEGGGDQRAVKSKVERL